jgi:hypothetical protein
MRTAALPPVRVSRVAAEEGCRIKPRSPVASEGTELWRRNPPPHVSQLRPAGFEHGYVGGDVNCAPASVASMARQRRLVSGLIDDAQLIRRLRTIGRTDDSGTNGPGILAMAEALGLRGESHGPGADLSWITNRLKQGHSVLANGNPTGWGGAPTERDAGHWVLVWEMLDSSFLVHDPYETKWVVTAETLTNFIRTHFTGGCQIAIGPRQVAVVAQQLA